MGGAKGRAGRNAWWWSSRLTTPADDHHGGKCVCVCVCFFLVGYPESGPRRNAAEALDANRTLSGHLLDVTLQSLKTGKGVVVDRGAYGSASCSPPVARWWW